MNLKSFRIYILLLLFSTFLPSISFSASIVKEEEPKLSVKMGAFIPGIERLEKRVEELEKEVAAHSDILKFLFSPVYNRNNRDFELFKAAYSYKLGFITKGDLREIRQRVSDPLELEALPTGLKVVLNGGMSPGIPAEATSKSVKELAKHAEAVLSPDRDHSTKYRKMTIGTISPSTIGSNPEETEYLTTKLDQLSLQDNVADKPLRRALFPDKDEKKEKR